MPSGGKGGFYLLRRLIYECAILSTDAAFTSLQSEYTGPVGGGKAVGHCQAQAAGQSAGQLAQSCYRVRERAVRVVSAFNDDQLQ